MKALTVSIIIMCVLVSAAVSAKDKETAAVIKPARTEKFKAKSRTKQVKPKAKLQKIEKTRKMKLQKIEEKSKPKLVKKEENLKWKVLWQAYCKTCKRTLGNWKKQKSAANGEKTGHLRLHPKHHVVVYDNRDD